MESSPKNSPGQGAGARKKTLRIILSLAFVVGVPLGVRSCLLYEGDWITCRIATGEGEIQVRVYPKKAPVTAANFLRYVEAGLYDGTTFFRVVTPQNQPHDRVRIEVIQGGDVDERRCFPPIAHETTTMTGLKHEDGAISMARAEPGTATSSFFICVGDQPELDFGGRRNPDGQGFAAFGRVVKGMEVVRHIQRLEADGQALRKPVAIRSVIRLLKPSELPENAGGTSWRKAGLGAIMEAIRSALARMTLGHYLALSLFLALAGWLAWKGVWRSRFARGESPVWEGSSWASGRSMPESTSLWLRVLRLVLFLLLLALVALILIGS